MRVNLKEEIIKLKREKNAVILSHFYQPKDVQEVADYIGDSYFLSKVGKECKEDTIVFCGVKFMAESAKLLSPNKKVIFPMPNATCPMAAMATKEDVLRLKEKHPNAKVVCYINSTADVKSVVDICCTSSSAIEIVNNLESDEIIFLPDKNLGSYIQEKIPNKKIILWDGYCHVHNKIKASDIIKSKEKYGKDIKVLVHPECRKEVRDLADYIGSTKGIINFAEKDNGKKYLIVTEYGIIPELKKKSPDKEFYMLDMCCSNMKKNSIKEIYKCLKNYSSEVNIDENIREKAARSLEKMHSLGV
ncbi:quinolinate synthetase [Clostridium novyi A str. 4552]|uniref:Quinolinate synthase n=1 Tax=Clostridium novyi A str. 4552 TaxID=1444289 RepID=A0A0A0IE89_CLONO|nr:quinolinate synthase NadA [Clostridium novyi]KGM97945.1 quinolinate synthetase [Clostridium novyi A str. 4552]